MMPAQTLTPSVEGPVVATSPGSAPARSVAGAESRVVVAMSGGLDSSVAAALLVEQGYDVVGMMMRLWSEPASGGHTHLNRCCTPDQMADARRVADRLQIPFYVIDVQDHFRRSIVQFFIDEHLAGRTPNPCVECNREIRFSFLLEHALALQARYLATGHYARLRGPSGARQILKAVDDGKDQSYVLHVLNQRQLDHVLFPIGAYPKSEVRELARKFGLPVAAKQESQDLCFIADGNHRRFLREQVPTGFGRGPIVTQAGQILGEHEGLPFYTIGQRKGLGIATPEPLYVLEKDVLRNALVVGPLPSLGRDCLIAHRLNWIEGVPLRGETAVEIKIRYRASAVPGTVTVQDDGRALARFAEPVFGVTPGQSVVFYREEVCLGGGLIAA